jgi:nitrate/nitrite transporter NarK
MYCILDSKGENEVLDSCVVPGVIGRRMLCCSRCGGAIFGEIPNDYPSSDIVLCVLPILWPKRIRASEGATTAGLGIGITATAGGLHGLVGPQIYQSFSGPTYRVSFSMSIGLTCFSVAGIAAMWVIIRKKQRKLVDDQKPKSSQTATEINEL